LLHSCWCIAFGCWNSNSKFEFYCLSLFKISKFYFLTYPSFPLSGPAASCGPAPLGSPAPRAPRPSPTPHCGPAGPPPPARSPACAALLLLTAGAQLSFTLGTKNREPRTEPKEPRTGTERTETEKIGSCSVPDSLEPNYPGSSVRFLG
jgi:hypothetical protein